MKPSAVSRRTAQSRARASASVPARRWPTSVVRPSTMSQARCRPAAPRRASRRAGRRASGRRRGRARRRGEQEQFFMDMLSVSAERRGGGLLAAVVPLELDHVAAGVELQNRGFCGSSSRRGPRPLATGRERLAVGRPGRPKRHGRSRSGRCRPRRPRDRAVRRSSRHLRAHCAAAPLVAAPKQGAVRGSPPCLGGTDPRRGRGSATPRARRAASRP